MSTFNLKPNHKPVKAYYEALAQFDRLGVTHETAVRSAFQSLVESCGKKLKWTLVPEHSVTLSRNKRIVVDGALIDDFNLVHGYWEAKDVHDNLPKEVARKFDAGYPRTNILFQTPRRAILWQNSQLVLDNPLTDPKPLIEILQAFFSYQPPAITEWRAAVAQFKDRVPEIGRGLAQLIRQERQANSHFTAAFTAFYEKCRSAINPNLSEAAVEEMLIQHLLTERIFQTVFKNPDFIHRNAIAIEIERVIDSLTSQSFSRRDFLRSLDRFYVAIERAAETIIDFRQKQHFLNTVYEQFFQGFSVNVADTHGIVYTPQPIVDFMVRSVEQLLKIEFSRSLSEPGVHIIDPFVGTGNFVARTMREFPKTTLEQKYRYEIHCNEVMLLPYYIASMNIEHEYYEATGRYRQFEGICLVDTFELAEDRQLTMFSAENAARVEHQRETPMFVIVGNPPYNAGQVNENDNNKNRKYDKMDRRVSETYAKASKATLKRYLQDPYTKAIRWATDRIGDEGIVALVTNNAFLDSVAFDGMRKYLALEFDTIYILDLGGNVRKNPKISGTTHNVFGVQVGVSINLLVKKRANRNNPARIFYASTDQKWRKEDKYRYLDSQRDYRAIDWKRIIPDEHFTWFTEGLRREFKTFAPLGNKDKAGEKATGEGVIFRRFSLGVSTNRDAWVYNYDRGRLVENVNRTIETYNSEVDRWSNRGGRGVQLDEFLTSDGGNIKWSRNLKRELKRGRKAEYKEQKVRRSLYRPFTTSYLFFDPILNDELSHFACIFPTEETEGENRVILVPSAGGRADYWCFCAGMTPNLTLTSLDGSQCFPFYMYDADGTNRRENISDWALREFRSRYDDVGIGKWDIFHYVYALLHHPAYRERYSANLRRELPRIPYAKDFRAFAVAGARLAEIHVGYEEQPEYPLRFIENRELPLEWSVERMKLSRDKTSIWYNEFLRLEGVPREAFQYRVGNRSALEWVIDQYRVKKDNRSGIVNEPDRSYDERYIVKLIAKVIGVSLETVRIVQGFPELRRIG